MEYRTKLRIVVAIDAALALAVLAAFAFRGPAGGRAARDATIVDSGRVAVMHFRGGGAEDVTLLKTGEGWVLDAGGDEFPALARRVDAFLSLLDRDGRLEEVAGTLAARPSLGLGPDRARSVTFLDGSGLELATVLLGAWAPAGGSVYLALEGSDGTWLAPGTIASYAGGDASSWLDLAVFPAGIRLAEVQGFRVEGSVQTGGAGSERGYSVARTADGWMETASGLALDPLRVESMLRALAGLQASAYQGGERVDGEATARIRIAMGDGSELELAAEAGLPDGGVPVRAGARRLVVPYYSLAEALRPLDALKPAP